MASYTLENLAQQSYRELEVLFAAGTVPADLRVLGTQPRGRMLAVRGFGGRLASSLVRGFARVPLWVGKTVSINHDGTTGTGTNRFLLHREWFPYVIGISQSVADAQPAIAFNYATSTSRLGRQLYNELREISPGTFLGTANRTKGPGNFTRLFFFAVTVNQ